MNLKQNLIVTSAIVAALITGYSLKSEPALAQESANGYIALKLDVKNTGDDTAFALISTEQKTVMIYKVTYQTGKRTSLELDSTRSFKFDERLESWKTKPKLSEIESAIKKNGARKKKR